MVSGESLLPGLQVVAAFSLCAHKAESSPVSPCYNDTNPLDHAPPL